MNITVHSAQSLRAADSGGTSDPYVIVMLSNQKLLQTAVVKKNVSPVWSGAAVSVSSADLLKAKKGTKVTFLFRIFDKDLIGKDDPLGFSEAVVDLAQGANMNKVWLPVSEGTGQLCVTIVGAPVMKQVELTDEQILEQEGGLAFFTNIKKGIQDQKPRDFILVIDKSGSMAGSNWRQAGAAVAFLADKIVQADPDGVSVYFFSSGAPVRVEGVTSGAKINDLFRQQSPGGSTDLAGVLTTVFNDVTSKSATHFFNPSAKPVTILVVTDGEPNSKADAAAAIAKMSQQLSRDEDMSISFIQVGSDSSAEKWLQGLDDNIPGAKFDIVDRVTASQMDGMSFEEFVRRSVTD